MLVKQSLCVNIATRIIPQTTLSMYSLDMTLSRTGDQTTMCIVDGNLLMTHNCVAARGQFHKVA